MAGPTGLSSARTLSREDLDIEGLPRDGRLWEVRWYCGVERNILAPSEPLVIVLITDCTSVGNLGARLITIGLTHVGLVRIGSRWTDGRFVDEHKASFKPFDGLVEADQHTFEPAICVRRVLSLSPNNDPGKILERWSIVTVQAVTGETLLIPTIELFSRCFGRSQYVKRILATLPYEEAERALHAPDKVAADKNCWLVTLDKHCWNEDAVFLAHLRHDKITQQRVRRLCGSFQASRDVSGETLVMPQVTPWWSTRVRLKCSGLYLWSRHNAFLVYRILGMSEPAGPILQVDRDNSSLTDGVDHIPEPEGRQRTHAKGQRQSGPTDLVHSQEPSGAYEDLDVRVSSGVKFPGIDGLIFPTRESVA